MTNLPTKKQQKTTKNNKKTNKKQQKTNKKQNKTKQNIKLSPHGIWKHFFSLSAIIGKRKALVPECSAGERDLELNMLVKTKVFCRIAAHTSKPTTIFGKDKALGAHLTKRVEGKQEP